MTPYVSVSWLVLSSFHIYISRIVALRKQKPRMVHNTPGRAVIVLAYASIFLSAVVDAFCPLGTTQTTGALGGVFEGEHNADNLRVRCLSTDVNNVFRWDFVGPRGCNLPGQSCVARASKCNTGVNSARNLLSTADAIYCVGCASGTSKVGAICQKCPGNTFREFDTPNTCQTCAAGKFPVEGGATCADHDCTRCVAGSYNRLEGQIECTLCGAGTYVQVAGRSICENCAPGNFCFQCVLVCGEKQFQLQTEVDVVVTRGTIYSESRKPIHSSNAAHYVLIYKHAVDRNI